MLIILFSAAYLSRSQSSLDYRWYINASYGLSQAHCDLQNNNNHITKLSDETKFGYGVQLAKYISPVFALNAQFVRAYLKGNKGSIEEYFDADLLEYKLATTVNFSNLFFGINRNRSTFIYGTTGLGLTFLRSSSKDKDGNFIRDIGYAGDVLLSKDDRLSTLVFPVGLGLDIKLTKRFYINLETVLRLTTNDNIDSHVSGGRKDAYYFTSVGLSYNFIKKKKRDKIDIPPDIVLDLKKDSIPDAHIDMVYVIPENLKANSEFDLKCIIKKGDVMGFGELMQILPIGFQVLDTVFPGARSEFRNYTLNLYYDQLPADTTFTVQYRVKVEDVYGNLPITSILFLDQTGKEYKFKTSVYVEKAGEIPEEIVASEEPVEIDGDEIEFRVQIRAAYKATIPLSYLAKKYHITDSIKENFVGNWYRYSIGSFKTYAEAREFRDIVIKQHKVYDAFVVAFRNGVRMNSLSELKDIIPSPFPQQNTQYTEAGTIFRVQILALLYHRVEAKTLNDIYRIEEQINEEIYGRWRKYTLGDFSSLEEADAFKQKMVNKGITDAFVVIYQNGQRITMNQ